jgi:ferredoxin
VAPSNGINVWCSSVGGELNTHSVITAIKTSRLNERVYHHSIILPQFSASGIDLELLKKETGRKGHFGPAYSRDIPPYLKDPNTVYTANRAEFSLPKRIELFFAMNFIAWFAIALIAIVFAPAMLLPVSLYFWLAGLVLYAGYPIIPGKSGWLKSAILTVIEIIGIALYTIFITKMPAFSHWKTMLVVTAINLMLGFDLRGTVAGYTSEAEWLMKKLGMKSFGHMFSAEKQLEGLIYQDIDKCNNCGDCLLVCPKGVFDYDEEKNIRIKQRLECFACNACVTQCPEDALRLVNE